MWVKICGVRDVAEALDVAAAAPDAIGLNFYPKSKRYVSPEIAAAICAELPTEIERVGVFVDHLPDEIAALARKLKLTRVQLHGDYDLEAAAALQEFRPVWVHRMLDADLTSLQKLFCTAHEKWIRFSACLIDAAVPGQMGGSGQTVDWQAVRASYPFEEAPPLILAGGLTPQNVRSAIAAVQPWGVDVASGVELNNRKDPELCQQFVIESRQ